MAYAGSFNTDAYQGRYLQFYWSTKRQDIANNKTVISWKLTGAGGDDTWYMTGNVSVSINGAVQDTRTERFQLYKGTPVLSGEYTVTHNADGSGSFSASVEAGIYSVAVNCEGSGNFTLDTISRASQPSCVTWPEHTQNVGSFGDTISIHMNRASSSLTHTVRYAFGHLTGTIATKVETGTTWKIPLSFMDLLPNATSGSGTIYVDTYSGSTLVGTKYCGFTATVPASVKPACSLTLKDITEVDKTYGSPVQGLSKIEVTINATEAYSSPIVSYAISIDGENYAADTATTGALRTAGDSPVKITVKDGRGRTATASYTMRVQSYALPSITRLTVHRCNADGTENEQGEYVRAVFDAGITSLNAKNTARYVLRYKKSTADSFTDVAFSDLNNVYKVSGKTYIFAADSSNSYDVEVEATDRHGTTTRSTSASTAFTLMNWGANGTSIAFGKVAERANAVEIALSMYDRFATLIGNGLAAYGGTDNPIDADTTIESHFLTQTGTPTTAFWHVLQLFYSSKTPTSNRIQVAFPYNRTGSIFKRYYVNGTGWSEWESEALQAYPVGSIYIAYNHTNPGTLFGGTWVRIENRFLWGVDSSGTIGQTGGEKTHTLTVNEMPKHTHGGTYTNAGTSRTHTWLPSGTGAAMGFDAVEAGGGAAHNNMPPYVQVSIWRRTA